MKIFEIRYEAIRNTYPDAKQCTVEDCPNPRDVTPLLGWDTTCAYHRLLFDHWLYNIAEPATLAKTHIRRAAFAAWVENIGRRRANQIVLRMANDPINWKC